MEVQPPLQKRLGGPRKTAEDELRLLEQVGGRFGLVPAILAQQAAQLRLYVPSKLLALPFVQGLLKPRE